MKKKKVEEYFFCFMNVYHATQLLHKKVKKDPYYMVQKKPLYKN